jgi:hypothetical protein
VGGLKGYTKGVALCRKRIFYRQAVQQHITSPKKMIAPAVQGDAMPHNNKATAIQNNTKQSKKLNFPGTRCSLITDRASLT